MKQITFFLRSESPTLNIPNANKNLENWMPALFEQLNESMEFWGIFDSILINGNYLKNTK